MKGEVGGIVCVGQARRENLGGALGAGPRAPEGADGRSVGVAGAKACPAPCLARRSLAPCSFACGTITVEILRPWSDKSRPADRPAFNRRTIGVGARTWRFRHGAWFRLRSNP